MPIGGKLMLKGGETLGVEKKKKKKKAKLPEVEEGAAAGEQQQGEQPPEGGVTITGQPSKRLDPTAINVMTGKTYEQEFDLEQKRMKEGKSKSTPWSSGYRAPPEVLHGYSVRVTGKNAEERLDLRCAAKSDKFCK